MRKTNRRTMMKGLEQKKFAATITILSVRTTQDILTLRLKLGECLVQSNYQGLFWR